VPLFTSGGLGLGLKNLVLFTILHNCYRNCQQVNDLSATSWQLVANILARRCQQVRGEMLPQVAPCRVVSCRDAVMEIGLYAIASRGNKTGKILYLIFAVLYHLSCIDVSFHFLVHCTYF